MAKTSSFIADYVTATQTIEINSATFAAVSHGFIHGYSDAGQLQDKYNLLVGTDKTSKGIYFGDSHIANASAIIQGVTDVKIAEFVASNHMFSIACQYGINKLKIHTDSSNCLQLLVFGQHGCPIAQ